MMTTLMHTLRCLATIALLMSPALALADTILDYSLKQSRTAAAIPQTITIKDGVMLVKSVGGDVNKDLLFTAADGGVKIIDHQRRTVMTVDERQLDTLSQQAKSVQPLLQGIREQIAKLSPEERRKWQELLGDSVSLDEMAKAGSPPPPTQLVATGVGKVAGIRCQGMKLLQGRAAMADLCVADAASLTIPAADFGTFMALLGLYERLAPKAQKLASQFGLSIPAIAMEKVTGLPVAVKDLSRENNGSVTLSRIRTATVSPELMKVPAGYASKPLKLW